MGDIKLAELEDQLRQLGCNFRFWGKAELRELAHVLLPGEQIKNCINGQYEGGFAMLCATDQRVLLIDKKPMYLTLEDIRFDMVAEVDYNHRLLNATIHICTPNKMLRFTAYNQARLREFFVYVQQRVMEIRQHYMHQMELQERYETAPMPQQSAQQPYAPVPAPPQPTQSFSEPYLASQQPAQAAPGPASTQQPPAPRRMVVPIVSAYTRLPLISRQRRYLGARALRSGLSSYNSQAR